MGKGEKLASQADKFRKQQRKKEKLKNKEKRKLSREISNLDKEDADKVGELLAKMKDKEYALDSRLKMKKQELQQEATALYKKKLGIPLGIKEYEQAMTVEARKTQEELDQENLERFPNPEESPYYHPTLNPFGAPPPGAPPLPSVSGIKSTLLLNAPLPKPLAIMDNGEIQPPISKKEELKVDQQMTSELKPGETQQKKEEEEEKSKEKGNEGEKIPSFQGFWKMTVEEIQQKFKDDVLEEMEEKEVDLSEIPLPSGIPPALNTNPHPPLPSGPPVARDPPLTSPVSGPAPPKSKFSNLYQPPALSRQLQTQGILPTPYPPVYPVQMPPFSHPPHVVPHMIPTPVPVPVPQPGIYQAPPSNPGYNPAYEEYLQQMKDLGAM